MVDVAVTVSDWDAVPEDVWLSLIVVVSDMEFERDSVGGRVKDRVKICDAVTVDDRLTVCDNETEIEADDVVDAVVVVDWVWDLVRVAVFVPVGGGVMDCVIVARVNLTSVCAP